MIQSMTGYGKAEQQFTDHKTIVEIRSVNSKQLDLTLKLNNAVRDNEPQIRALLASPLERGKVDVNIYTVEDNAVNEVKPKEWKITGHLLFGTLRVMEVPREQKEELKVDFAELEPIIKKALADYQAFRTQEGASLEAMFQQKLSAIEQLLAEVEPYEKNRVATIKARLMNNLEELSKKEKVEIDKNRLEAEMIYYLEKLDITEEKVRLTNHIRYFRETLAANGEGVGKKLGFIAQEMGREINTLGSKSNQSEMQIIVVKMKDLLEQIKEQVLNVL